MHVGKERKHKHKGSGAISCSLGTKGRRAPGPGVYSSQLGQGHPRREVVFAGTVTATRVDKDKEDQNILQG